MESFQGGGEVLPTEVVEGLEIGLGVHGGTQRQGCDGSDEDLFGHNAWFRKNYSDFLSFRRDGLISKSTALSPFGFFPNS